MVNRIAQALLLVVVACLAGCANFQGAFENRLTTTLSGNRVFVTSLYGPIGITAELAAEDALELQTLREKARMADQIIAAMRAQAASNQRSTNP